MYEGQFIIVLLNMSIEIIRGKNEEECIEGIEKIADKYEVVSRRKYVENWMTFWKKSYEMVYKVVDKKEVNDLSEESESLRKEEEEITPEFWGKNEEKMKILQKLNNVEEDEEKLTPEQMKIKQLMDENARLKEGNVPKDFNCYFEMLKSKEIDDVMAKELVKEVADTYPSSEIEDEEVMSSLKNLIGSKIKVRGPMESEKTKVIALIGPTGVGKTTTLAKLGWELYTSGKTVGFITTDTFRSGAKEQLEGIGEIMEAEVIVAKGSKELKSAIRYFENANQVDHILIDTVGRNPMLKETSDAVKEYLDIAKPDLTCLVMSSTSKVADMKKTLERFSTVNVDGLIFTKLDETFNPGSIINVFNYTDIPLMYVANGQDITKNLFAPTKEVLINKILTDEKELEGKTVI